MKIFTVFLVLIYSLFVTAEEDRLTPAIGFGLSSLHFSLNNTTDYSPTNTNFYFMSLGYKRLSFQAKLPQLDSEETRQTKVDTKIQDYQLSFNVIKNWKTVLFFQDYKGYYIQNSILRLNVKAPDLKLNHIGGHLFYIFNDKHDSFLIQDTNWDQNLDSSSWIVSAGVDQFEINGDLIPNDLKTDKNQILKNLKVDSYNLRMSYSRNWVWTHWFLGTAFGLGYNLNQVNTNYAVDYRPPTNKSNDNYLNYLFAMSWGYKWQDSKFGVFGRLMNWNIDFDNIQISSNTSTNGFYYSQTF